MTGDEQHLLGAVNDASTLALLREVIRIPSENPPGQELAKARHLAEYLARHGISARLDKIAPGRPDLIAESALGDGAAGPTLVFNGHLDTLCWCR
jgi:succinyl-diaminopimelate desuccinylase